MQPAERKKAWHERRVFFLTPQVLMNDLSRGVCPALLVKCLVVDEAHKALGNHAYCQVCPPFLTHYENRTKIFAVYFHVFLANFLYMSPMCMYIP